MECFMIVPPVNAWDKPNEEKILLHMGLGTIGRTAGEAWSRKTGGDLSKVQAWHDKGYRLRRINIELIEER